MALKLKMLARLHAYRSGRAVRYATHLKVAIQPHALVLSPVAMAGEDTTVHAVACGQLGRTPTVFTVPDPRIRDDQFQLFERLGEIVEDYFERCYRDADYPQILVSSSAAAEHLSTLADRFRFNRSNDRVRRFGELLTYVTDRYPHAGQQALHTATAALKLHFATGQDEGEDEHLLALLTWIEPPVGHNVLAAVAEAELVPMGVKTDPGFDRDHLVPLVTAYNEARRNGASVSELSRRADLIRDILTPVVVRIYQETQRAAAVLNEAALPNLQDLPELEDRETDEFANFMRWSNDGNHIPLRDGPRRAAFGLTAREDAQENFETAIMLGDALERAQARLDGRILVGEIENPQRIRLAVRQFDHIFDLRTRQRGLQIRIRDTLHSASDSRLQVVVTNVRRDGDSSIISLRIVRGQRSIGLPHIGERMEFVDQIPNWGWLQRVRGQLSGCLAVTPWTHAEDPLPVARPAHRPMPADPLAAVEDLRVRRGT